MNELNASVSTPAEEPKRFTFQLADLFWLTAAVAIVLAVFKTWHLGYAAIASLLIVAIGLRLPRHEPTSRLGRRYRTMLTTVALSSVVFSALGWPIGLFLSNNSHVYPSGHALAIDDICIYAHLEGQKSMYCIPPFIAGWYEVAPYRAGLRIVDYDNQNECQRVEITALEILHVETTPPLMASKQPISTTFAPYISGVDHVSSECTAEVGPWLTSENDEALVMHVQFKIYKADGSIIEDDMRALLVPAHHVGLGLIWELLQSRG